MYATLTGLMTLTWMPGSTCKPDFDGIDRSSDQPYSYAAEVNTSPSPKNTVLKTIPKVKRRSVRVLITEANVCESQINGCCTHGGERRICLQSCRKAGGHCNKNEIGSSTNTNPSTRKRYAVTTWEIAVDVALITARVVFRIAKAPAGACLCLLKSAERRPFFVFLSSSGHQSEL